MKIVRLNDKMWFGKYKNLTIKDVICRDKDFLDKLMNVGKIGYHDNVIKFIDDTYGKKNDFWMPEPLPDFTMATRPPVSEETNIECEYNNEVCDMDCSFSEEDNFSNDDNN